MAYDWRTEWPGVFARHADSCPVRNGHRCTCGPLGYRASARDPETGRRVLSPDFQTVAEARAWLGDQHESLEAARGAERSERHFGGLIDDFVQAAENGLARDGNGLEYAPSQVRELRDSLSYAEAQLGTMRVDDVRRRHVQGMVDELYSSGVDIEQIRAVVAALSSMYTYALQRDLADFSPIVQLSLPDPAKRVMQASMNGRSTAGASLNGEPTQPLAAPAMATAPLATAPMPTPPPMATPPMPTLPPTAAAPFATPPPATDPMATAPMAPNPFATPPMGAEPMATQPMAAAPAAMPQTPVQHTSAMWTPGSLTPPQNPEPYRDALMPERVLWWTVLIIVVVSVLIAIVLAAESV
jgi:hypothetical protein